MLHAFREQETPNADPFLAGNNHHLGAQSTTEALAKFSRLLPVKRRKDAVLAIEYLITASPDDMESKTEAEQLDYLLDAWHWLRERHGQNLFYAGMHFDETTPHLYAYVVPLDPQTGRLNAKKWLSGPKALAEMQTEFADKVGAKHGLERGIPGSRATHRTVKEFYGAISSPPVEHGSLSARLLTPRPGETTAQLAKRLTQLINKHYNPAILEASSARLERRRAAEMARTAAEIARQAEAAQARLLKLEGLIEGLDEDLLAEILEQARQDLQLEQSRPKGG